MLVRVGFAGLLASFGVAQAEAQGTPPQQAAPQQQLAPPIDSIAVVGTVRLVPEQVVTVGGIPLHSVALWSDVARAMSNLFSTGQFDDVRVESHAVGGKFVLVYVVKERPLLRDWSLIGPVKILPRVVKDYIVLNKGRALDRTAVAKAKFEIDSMYHKEGYYTATTVVTETPTTDGGVTVAFKVTEGNRVAISAVEIVGNKRFTAKELVRQIDSKPEGFLWNRPGEYDEDLVDHDLRELLPAFYGKRGMIDFQVTGDTLLPDPKTGKAILRISVEEGETYKVGTFEILGNNRFSTDQLEAMFPFALPGAATVARPAGEAFDRDAWEKATEKAHDLYTNNGYIQATVEAEQSKRVLPDGTPVLDLRWKINEGAPASINSIKIVGNEVTHDRVIREAIVVLPGELFNREKLVRSYQNISNLGFFQQPLPNPDMIPSANGKDVDIVFHVQEKHTGNINFGASVGQGTGLGGFLGLEEPNLFGRGKRGKLQWQFGQNITDFTLSYSDPALFDTRVSSTVTLYDSQLRYVVGDLGRQRQVGGSLQFGLPFFGSRYSRIFASYGFQQIRYDQGSPDLQATFRCSPCTRSTLGLSFLRDTRIGLPFPIAGSIVSIGAEQNGGILGGTGDYQKLNIDTKWFAPLGSMGGKPGSLGGGVQFTLALAAKSGFIFGDAASFFTELYTLGGVQYGIPLRGYDEFSITPNGYNPNASSQSASPSSFGKSYAAFTLEAGARISQSIYTDIFFDAGNVYRSVRQYNPTRLFRGVGLGAALNSPLGLIGVDFGYGLDKTDLLGHPAPGWQLHFRLGNFF